jgi:hypothetical protein
MWELRLLLVVYEGAKMLLEPVFARTSQVGEQSQ